VLTEVKLQPLGQRWAFLEFSRRRGDFALAGVALHYDLKGETIANMHIGAIGVGDAPLRLHAVEDVLNGRKLDDAAIDAAAKTAKEVVDPPSDIHAPSDYRRALLATLLERALRRWAA